MRTLREPISFSAPDSILDTQARRQRVTLHPSQLPHWTFVVQGKKVPLTIDTNTTAHLLRVPTDHTLAVGTNGTCVNIIEHIAALRDGIGLESAVVEVHNGNDLPYIAAPGVIAGSCHELLQGSRSPRYTAAPYERTWENGRSIMYEPDQTDRLTIRVEVDYPDPIGKQTLTWHGDPEQYLEYADARAQIRTQAERTAARIIRAAGIPITLLRECRLPHELYPGEASHHRLTDLLGALAYLRPGLAGTITAVKTSHRHEMELVRHIASGTRNNVATSHAAPTRA